MFNEKQQLYGPDVHGLIAFMDWLKNKNGPEGVRYPMVFDGNTGYKPELTDFEILYTEGLYGIKGSPLSYHLAVLPEITFTRKTLLEKCHENPLLARALSFTTRLYLVSKIINRETPPDISDFEEADFESRVTIILNHSCDYPGYVNFGWTVPDEYQKIADNFNRMLSQREYPNIGFSKADVEMFKISNGELIDTRLVYSVNNDDVIIGETEYVLADNDANVNWKFGKHKSM